MAFFFFFFRLKPVTNALSAMAAMVLLEPHPQQRTKTDALRPEG